MVSTWVSFVQCNKSTMTMSTRLFLKWLHFKTVITKKITLTPITILILQITLNSNSTNKSNNKFRMTWSLRSTNQKSINSSKKLFQIPHHNHHLEKEWLQIQAMCMQTTLISPNKVSTIAAHRTLTMPLTNTSQINQIPLNNNNNNNSNKEAKIRNLLLTVATTII